MQIKTIDINKGFKPYWFQKEFLLKFKDCVRGVFLLPRQHGKSEIGIQCLASFLFEFNERPNPRAAVIMATAKQAFHVYFSRLHEQLRDLPEDIYDVRVSDKDGGRIVFYRPHFNDYATIRFLGSQNIKAVRGETMDFVIADEMSSYRSGEYDAIIAPLTGATGGKILLTSTVEGYNEFYSKMLAYKKFEDEGVTDYCATVYNVEECRMWSKDKIERTRREAELSGTLHIFLQEFYHDPTAASTGEAPFAPAVFEIFKNSKVVDRGYVQSLDASTINIGIDVGVKTNTVCWAFLPNPRNSQGVLLYDCYNDHKNLKHMIDNTFERFKDDFQFIRLIYPSDIEHTSLTDGITRLQIVHNYIQEKGYQNRIKVEKLNKIGVKELAFTNAISCLENSSYCGQAAKEGLHILAQIKFKKDKATGTIQYGKTVQNGHQHWGDAFISAVEGILNGHCPPYIETNWAYDMEQKGSMLSDMSYGGDKVGLINGKRFKLKY